MHEKKHKQNQEILHLSMNGMFRDRDVCTVLLKKIACEV